MPKGTLKMLYVTNDQEKNKNQGKKIYHRKSETMAFFQKNNHQCQCGYRGEGILIHCWWRTLIGPAILEDKWTFLKNKLGIELPLTQKFQS